MKLTHALVLSLILLGALAAAPLAHAVLTNHSGTICKNSSRGDVTFIEYPTNGTRSYKTSVTSVICPLTRKTTNPNGADVFVDVTHTGTQTTNCYAYSYNATGELLGATGSGNQTFSGPWTIPLYLSGAGKSTYRSDYVVRCAIPGNGNAIIHGIDLEEF